jgi:hypothetical protein
VLITPTFMCHLIRLCNINRGDDVLFSILYPYFIISYHETIFIDVLALLTCSRITDDYGMKTDSNNLSKPLIYNMEFQ